MEGYQKQPKQEDRILTILTMANGWVDGMTFLNLEHPRIRNRNEPRKLGHLTLYK